MRFLSRLFQEPTEVRRGEVVRCDDIRAHTAGGDLEIVHVPGREGQRVLPRFVVDFLWSCDAFEPLEVHLARHLEDTEHPATQSEALMKWVPECRAEGLLIGAADVVALCRASNADAGGEIAGLGFPAGNNVPRTRRCVESFAANATRHGRRPALMVADDSLDPGVQREYRRALAATGKSHGLEAYYAGLEEKRRYMELLIERSRCTRETLEFALFDVDRVGFACGANRNALILHHAGQIFSSIDDDVTCELGRPPGAEDTLRLFSQCDPFERWYFPDQASARAHLEMADVDYCAMHERLVGRDAGRLEGLEEMEVAEAGLGVLDRLRETPCRVRASFIGHAGDPGIPTSYYFLSHGEANRRRLTESEEAYRKALASRSVVTCATRWAVGDGTASPGMAFALDGREVVPPFFPVLHAEDFSFGAALWRCCPGSMLAHVPWAIDHDPGIGKPILKPGELHDQNRATIFEFAHFVRAIIFGWRPPIAETTAEGRLQALGRHFGRIGTCRMEDYTEFIRDVVLQVESGKIRTLEKNLLEDQEAPDFWRRDVEAYIEHTRDSLTHAEYDLPYDLKAGRSAVETRLLMRRLLTLYGRLLEEWPAIFRAARGLAKVGVRLGQRLEE